MNNTITLYVVTLSPVVIVIGVFDSLEKAQRAVSAHFGQHVDWGETDNELITSKGRYSISALVLNQE